MSEGWPALLNRKPHSGLYSDGHVHQATDIYGPFDQLEILSALRSHNWDGDGISLADGFDAGATKGWLWDAIVGSGQVMENLWVGGDVTLIGSGKFQTAASGKRIEMGTSTQNEITFRSASALKGYLVVEDAYINLTAPSATLPGDTTRPFLQIDAGSVGLWSKSFMDGLNPGSGSLLSVEQGAIRMYQDEDSGGGGLVERFNIDQDAATYSVPVLLPDGTIEAPGLAFANDTDTGWRLPAAGQMAAIVAGAPRFNINTSTSLIEMNLPISMGTDKITNMGDPTADQDAATKTYVDTRAGTWNTWNPSLQNATNGNGTLVGYTMEIGDMVIAYMKWTLGSTSTVSTGFAVTPPFTIHADWVDAQNLGDVGFEDTGTAIYYGKAWATSSTSLRFRPFNATSTYVFGSLASGTVPFTWTTGNRLTMTAIYRKA